MVAEPKPVSACSALKLSSCVLGETGQIGYLECVYSNEENKEPLV